MVMPSILASGREDTHLTIAVCNPTTMLRTFAIHESSDGHSEAIIMAAARYSMTVARGMTTKLVRRK